MRLNPAVVHPAMCVHPKSGRTQITFQKKALMVQHVKSSALLALAITSTRR